MREWLTQWLCAARLQRGFASNLLDGGGGLGQAIVGGGAVGYGPTHRPPFYLSSPAALLAELAELRKPMDDANNTTGTLAADEDILTYTVSDEAIEAAAGVGGTTPMCTSVAVPCQSLDLKCIY